jgi:hypothetical protein
MSELLKREWNAAAAHVHYDIFKTSVSGEGRGLLTGLRGWQRAPIRAGIKMRNPGWGNGGWRSHAAGKTRPQVVSGEAEFANVRGQALALLHCMLDRMRCGKSLRTEQ